MRQFIAVAGNIGVGKSTLTALLTERLGWEALYEAVDDNPYLADFYRDMRQWSFHSQVFFLSRRLRHHHSILDRPGTVVQDRSVYEDAEIFAENLYRQGQMNQRDYATYRGLYEAMAMFLPPPDLVIYLRASVGTLLKRIHMRGRDYEQKVSGDYLEQLNQLYEEWIERFALCPVLTVPSDNLDFVKYNSHMELITAKIVDKLRGKEVVTFE
jgi:deoxyadenosine/deoxycytidine kinase